MHPFNGGTKGWTTRSSPSRSRTPGRLLPQSGVKAADIVYVEQVEGGETRLMAVYSSKLPKKVGPVRSARISDLHILPSSAAPRSRSPASRAR